MQNPQHASTNARRFINAYNQIDNGLRSIYNMKRSISFSQLIRNAVTVNHVVRKYEDDLIDFGRLRNSIIHRSNDEYVIAEPHAEVVEEIERIARLITTPPNALATVCKASVLTVEYNVTVKNVIKLMARHSFSNLPIYKDGALIGIANGQKILEEIGRQLEQGANLDGYLQGTEIHQIVKGNGSSKKYEVSPASSTVEEVLSLFNNNPKLVVVLITKNGTMSEPPLGIITTSNVLEMNNILDNY